MSQVRDSELALGHDLGAIPRARHWAADRCAELTGDLDAGHRADLLRVVELVTTELVANAVEHGSPPLSVALDRQVDEVQVRVADGSREMPVRREQPAEATSGRGIALVGYLARRWGAERTATGKVVWCELAVDGPFPL